MFRQSTEPLQLARGPERRIFGGEVATGCSLLQCCNALDGQDVLVEDEAKLARGLVGHGFQRGERVRLFKFFGQAGHTVVGDAAGNDHLEVAQVGGDIEGEAVRGDSLGHMDADGGDLPLGVW